MSVYGRCPDCRQDEYEESPGTDQYGNRFGVSLKCTGCGFAISGRDHNEVRRAMGALRNWNQFK